MKGKEITLTNPSIMRSEEGTSEGGLPGALEAMKEFETGPQKAQNHS